MPEELFGFSIILEEDPSRLVVKPLDGVPVTHYQVEMIAGNDIPGLLTVSVRRRDGQISISYDIGSYIPLSLYLKEEEITRDEFLLFIHHLKNIFREGRKYFLSQDSFVLVERYIYVKKGLQDIALLYIPADIRQDINSSLKDLLISIIAHSPDAGDPAMTSFLKNTREGSISLGNLDKYIRQFLVQNDTLITLDSPGFWAVSGGTGSSSGPEARLQAGNEKGAKTDMNPGKSRGKNIRLLALGTMGTVVAAMAVFSLISEKSRSLQAAVPYLQAAAELVLVLGSAGAVVYIYMKTRGESVPKEEETCGEAGVNESFHTRPAGSSLAAASCAEPAGNQGFVPVIYKKSEKKRDQTEGKEKTAGKSGPVLVTVREGKQEKIFIDKSEFFIGRNKMVADYGEISDQRVEKLHVKIMKKETGYQIMDLDTGSGTFVNGEKIAGNRPFPIKYKDVIGLAGQEFVFEES